jgi:hypothetical protein
MAFTELNKGPGVPEQPVPVPGLEVVPPELLLHDITRSSKRKINMKSPILRIKV